MGIRCFIAVPLDKDIKKEIASSTENLKKTGSDVRWVSVENLHITLKFLGDTDEQILPLLKEKLSIIASSSRPFSLTLQGTGVFPDQRRPRVVWIDIKDHEELMRLQEEIEEVATSLGFSREDRPFSPHLTIGRVRSPRNIAALLAALEKLKEKDFGNIDVRSVCLMKSELRSAGAQYETIMELNFAR